MATLIATSVVRGNPPGESPGAVYLVDLERERVMRPLDWNTTGAHGQERGPRGIAFDEGRVFIAASDELFVYNRKFDELASYRCRYLRRCQEIRRYRRRLYLASAAFDAILAFDLDANRFSWGLHVSRDRQGLCGTPFRPEGRNGPEPGNALHLNSVFCDRRALFLSGRRTGGLHAYTGRYIRQAATLPQGIHNARPFRDGVLFNDTEKNLVRFVPEDGPQKVFRVPYYNPSLLVHTGPGDSETTRQAFGRGLCVVGDGLIAAGSSPSTVSLYDLDAMQTTLSINLSMDVRQAVHGLEVWPFDDLPEDSIERRNH